MILAAVVLPITLGSAAVFAAGGGKGSGRGFDGDCGRGGMMNPEVFAQQCDTRTESKMAELRLKQRDAMQAQRSSKQAEMRAFKQQERDLVMSANFDEAAAKKLAEQMVQRQAEQRAAMMKQRNEMMNVDRGSKQNLLLCSKNVWMNVCYLVMVAQMVKVAVKAAKVLKDKAWCVVPQRSNGSTNGSINGTVNLTPFVIVVNNDLVSVQRQSFGCLFSFWFYLTNLSNKQASWELLGIINALFVMVRRYEKGIRTFSHHCCVDGNLCCDLTSDS